MNDATHGRRRLLAAMISIHEARLAAGPLREVLAPDWSGAPTIVVVGGRRWRVWLADGERHAALLDGDGRNPR